MLKRLTFKNLFRLAVLSLVLSGLGRISNQVVVKANGGYMPVLRITHETESWVAADDDHVLLTTKSRYKALADLFPEYMPRHGEIDLEGVASIGDAFIWSGFALSIYVILGFIVFIPVGLARGVVYYANLLAEPVDKIKSRFSRTKTKTVV